MKLIATPFFLVILAAVAVALALVPVLTPIIFAYTVAEEVWASWWGGADEGWAVVAEGGRE